MMRQRKILMIGLWSTVAIGAIAIAAVHAAKRAIDERSAAGFSKSDEEHLPALFPAPPFKLTDQDGKAFGSDDLRGHTYVAMLFFTRCADTCPMMTGKMTKLQQALPDERLRFVSLSVDPAHDTPDVLKQYATKAADGAAVSRWHLLTGEKVAALGVARNFKLVANPANGDEPILHSDKFLLVDRDGVVRGIYEAEHEDEMNQLRADAAELVGKS